METENNSIPRRNRIDLMHPIELDIHSVILEIEKLGTHTALTNAIILLSKAKDHVSDYVDGIDREPLNKNILTIDQLKNQLIVELERTIKLLKEKINLQEKIIHLENNLIK